MTKEQFIQNIEFIKANIKHEQNRLLEIKEEYIRVNKFCEIGKEVKIELASGRIIQGKVNSFAIFADKNVYVNSYINDKNKTLYITVPYKRIKLIE